MGLSPEQKKNLKIKDSEHLTMVKQAEKSSSVKENICEDGINALSKMGSGMSFQGASHLTVSLKLAFMMVLYKFCTSSAVNTVNSFPL